MTRTVVFDTETTGVPTNKKYDALRASNNWPSIVSICWMVFEDKVYARTENHIIKPEGWLIPEVVVKIHGITTEKAMAEGKPLREIMMLFKEDVAGADQIVAHNIHFDKNVVFNAYKWQLQMDPTEFWKESAELCSMERARAEMRIPSPYSWTRDFKPPKLDELYEDTFKVKAPADAHNAMRDVDVLQQILWKRW